MRTVPASGFYLSVAHGPIWSGELVVTRETGDFPTWHRSPLLASGPLGNSGEPLVSGKRGASGALFPYIIGTLPPYGPWYPDWPYYFRHAGDGSVPGGIYST